MSFENKYYKISRDIRWQVERGERKFIIYPFGVNGVMAAEILKTQFGIQPAYILDNTLCKYNSAIHSIDFLDRLDKQEYMLLLTIENPKIIEAVRYAVYAHFPKERVLELFPDRIAEDVRVTWLRRFARFAYEKGMQGSVAECGVNQGGFAQYLNMFFPDRKCYLFDSFEGFRESDLASDDSRNALDAIPERISFSAISAVIRQQVLT